MMFESGPAPDESEWWNLETENLPPHVLLAVLELQQYAQEFKVREKDPFWQRKSGKRVLAVVIMRRRDGELAAFRGMNTEVSLITGSLCAEKAAIAAAASDFGHTTDLLAVAVVDPDEKIVPLWPCESCQCWLSKLKAQTPSSDLLVIPLRSVEKAEFAVFSWAEWSLIPPPRRRS